MLLLTIFGCSALFHAAIDIYALIAYSVQQRTQELGIRMALGAQSSTVRELVVWHGMRLAIVDMLIGPAAAFGLTRFIANLLYSVKYWDPVVHIVIPFLPAAVALIAVWLPASRATRIDPLEALRYD
jgi:ABC-type lipoprotein release transport system permease subunit